MWAGKEGIRRQQIFTVVQYVLSVENITWNFPVSTGFRFRRCVAGYGNVKALKQLFRLRLIPVKGSPYIYQRAFFLFHSYTGE